MTNETTKILFDADYTPFANVSKEEYKPYVMEKLSTCKMIAENESLFQSFSEKQLGVFTHFACMCNILAVQAYTEISIALHTDTKMISVILLGKHLDFGKGAMPIVSNVFLLCNRISVEAAEEDGLTTVMLLQFDFDSIDEKWMKLVPEEYDFI